MSALTLMGILNCFAVGFFVGLGWFISSWVVSKIFK